ncbi:MAG: hypothetical protein JNM68_15290, partial [Dinghuibacter sp.]|nr:hypothetical protein [Dinghuibacter sp.]
MQFDTKKGTGEYIKQAANTRGSTVGCIADNRPQTIVQRKQLAGMQPASEKLSAEHAAGQAVAATLQMKQTATPPKTIQLQKAQGRYRVRTNANLRNNNDAHTVLKVIQRGSEVTVIDKGRRQSNFKAGWVTNEHSWVRDGEEFSQEGWIEDGKLQPLEGRSVGLLGSDTDYRSDPSPFEVQPHFFETANDLPHPGDRVSMSDWTNYEGYQLQNKYPVFFREVHSGGNPEVQFIAVDTSSGMVVASSGASFKKGKGSDHEDYIKAFSSHPPFAGL